LQPAAISDVCIRKPSGALKPSGLARLNLFPDGNADAAAVCQAALLIVPNVQTQQELLGELRTDIIQPELPGTQGPSIRIMSLHKSKGLTARLVVIAACVAATQNLEPTFAR
jgi:hypothetical protein